MKDFKTSKCAMSNVCNFGSAFPLISNLSKYPLPSSDYLLILCNSLEMEKSQLTIDCRKIPIRGQDQFPAAGPLLMAVGPLSFLRATFLLHSDDLDGGIVDGGSGD